jgi:hypothetical protein
VDSKEPFGQVKDGQLRVRGKLCYANWLIAKDIIPRRIRVDVGLINNLPSSTPIVNQQLVPSHSPSAVEHAASFSADLILDETHLYNKCIPLTSFRWNSGRTITLRGRDGIYKDYCSASPLKSIEFHRIGSLFLFEDMTEEFLDCFLMLDITVV